MLPELERSERMAVSACRAAQPTGFCPHGVEFLLRDEDNEVKTPAGSDQGPATVFHGPPSFTGKARVLLHGITGNSLTWQIHIKQFPAPRCCKLPVSLCSVSAAPLSLHMCPQASTLCPLGMTFLPRRGRRDICAIMERRAPARRTDVVEASHVQVMDRFILVAC
ncbi:hypothetical protein JOB18_039983 [Solea senegalensis]|uniref:Uncharacterized protein n=1 Tax=Solea senegalensis TaxID=28829 RepID=A0AAV6SHE4_SOLSE|nr:hypothetical protein JOB18_039983 [Solea senegalensis]